MESSIIGEISRIQRGGRIGPSSSNFGRHSGLAALGSRGAFREVRVVLPAGMMSISRAKRDPFATGGVLGTVVGSLAASLPQALTSLRSLATPENIQSVAKVLLPVIGSFVAAKAADVVVKKLTPQSAVASVASVASVAPDVPKELKGLSQDQLNQVISALGQIGKAPTVAKLISTKSQDILNKIVTGAGIQIM